MKREIAWYVERGLTCHIVKAEHQRPHGKLQPPEVHMWKWEDITRDFITKLPQTSKGHDEISVIVDWLTKSSHFLAIWDSLSAEELADLYVRDIFVRHGTSLQCI